MSTPNHTPIDLVGNRVAIPKAVYEALLARDKKLTELLSKPYHGPDGFDGGSSTRGTYK